jgi:hypothetical protein
LAISEIAAVVMAIGAGVILRRSVCRMGGHDRHLGSCLSGAWLDTLIGIAEWKRKEGQ